MMAFYTKHYGSIVLKMLGEVTAKLQKGACPVARSGLCLFAILLDRGTMLEVSNRSLTQLVPSALRSWHIWHSGST